MEHTTLPHQHGQSKEQLLNHMPATENFELVSSIFKQLSDPTRIRIFWILCHCEECVINISAMMEMSSPAVAHHLRLLRSEETARKLTIAPVFPERHKPFIK